MLDSLKQAVYEANLLLPAYQLVTFTWGNVSQVDPNSGIMAIKPSGIDYSELKVDDIVLVDIKTGEKVEGKLNPSSDTPTHLELYRQLDGIGGIVHTHSQWATIFSQSGMNIPALGTTHADYFNGEVPCTRKMTAKEINGAYETETGRVIAETLRSRNPKEIPAALVHSHGPFTWGKDGKEAVHNAVVLEEIAFIAWHNLMMRPGIPSMQQELLDRHFKRKHGKNSYYGQKKT